MRGERKNIKIKTRSFSQIKPQLFIGDKPSTSKFKPIKNNKSHPKPDGGFWTSTFENNTSAWQKFAEDKFSSKSGTFLFKVKKEAKVMIIENKKDLDNLQKMYPPPKSELKQYLQELNKEKKDPSLQEIIDNSSPLFSIMDPLCDYEKLQEDYHGLQIKGRALGDMRVNAWDAESTLWFSLDLLELIDNS